MGSVQAWLPRRFPHFSRKHIDHYIDEFVFRVHGVDVKKHTIEHIEATNFDVVGKRLSYTELDCMSKKE